MRARSLGYLTDMAVTRFDGTVTDRGDYIVVRTPSNPTFHWGNYVLFPEPPRAEDLALDNPRGWLAIYERELEVRPGEGHRLFAWDRTDGAMGAAADATPAGFHIDETIILAARSAELTQPPRWNPDVEVRAIAGDAEWARAADVLRRAFGDGASLPADATPESRRRHAEATGRFVDQQIPRFRAMVAAGRGQWFGGFVGSTLAAALGIVSERRSGVTLGRYQLVGTDPAFQRRGVSASLVFGAATFAFETMGVDTLVIAADAQYHAARVYESVGLRPIERLCALLRR